MLPVLWMERFNNRKKSPIGTAVNRRLAVFIETSNLTNNNRKPIYIVVNDSRITHTY
jgi:hypothetical protein